MDLYMLVHVAGDNRYTLESFLTFAFTNEVFVMVTKLL
jgi:hypothetical protein